MKVLVTGADGQLGYELQRTLPKHYQLTALNRAQLDITNTALIQKIITEIKPALIINAAAYTAVDAAEKDPAMAKAINTDAVANLAKIAAQQQIKLFHLSTDFIFDGKKSAPYQPEDKPNPLNQYGSSKLAGEQALQTVMPDQSLILRTSWVYSAHGKNFVKTILQFLQQREELKVIADQVGVPTWANSLATSLWQIAEQPDYAGTYHYTDAGTASWYDFAVAIQEEAVALKLLSRLIPIIPITTADYPLPATRPSYSVLDKTSTMKKFNLPIIHWRQALRKMLMEAAVPVKAGTAS